VASYDHRGKHVFVGNSRGRVLVLTEEEGAGEAERGNYCKTVVAFRVSQQVKYKE